MKTVSTILRNWMLGNRFGVKFDAANDFGSIAAAPRLMTNGDVTVEALIVPDPTGTGTLGIIMQAGIVSTNERYSMRYDFTDKRIRFRRSSGGAAGGVDSPNNSVPLGAVSHVAMRRAGTSITFFVNGVQAAAPQTLSASNATATAFRFGDQSAGSSPYKGLISYGRVWVRALSNAEIAACAAGAPASYLGCQLFVPFLEGSGVTAADLSGNGYDLTLSGSPAWQAFNPGYGDQRKFSMKDLYTFTLAGGLVLRYTNADAKVVFGGNTFVCDSVQMARGQTRSAVGVEVSQLEVRATAKPTDLVGGAPFLHLARTGGLDGATLLLQRAFMVPDSSMVVGVLTLFSGRIADISIVKPVATITVKSDTELLNVLMPRNVVQPGCVHTLYDGGCGLNRTHFDAQLTVDSGSTVRSIRTDATHATGAFSLGVITFTSGALNGIKRSVRTYLNTNGEFRLWEPLPVAPQAGDTLTAVLGCDKTQGTCGAIDGKTFTVNAGTDVVTFSAPLADNRAVKLTSTGTLPGPLVAGTRYFIVEASGSTAKLATTMGGTPINITNTGSGTHSVSESGKFANLIQFRGYPYVPAAETAA